MRLRLLMPLLTLVLAACLHSDRPFIASVDLVAPAGPEGRYWVIGADDLDNKAGTIRFSRDAAGMVVADTGDQAEHEGGHPPRFVRVADPDLYLMIGDTDEQTSSYYLFRKEANGIWRMFNLSISKQGPFLSERKRFLNGIAGRYGFSLDLDGNGAAIKGPVSNGKIPALFRDQDFQAALDVDLDTIFLPRSGNFATPPAEEVEAEPHSTGAPLIGGPLVFTGAFKNWQGAVRPPRLNGAYLEEYRTSGLAKGATRFKLRPDGRFDLIAVDLAVQVIFFVPLNAGSWLGVEEHNSNYEGKPDRRYLFYILKPETYGWSLDDLFLEVPWQVPELARERLRAMKVAATHRGLSFDGSYLNGETTLAGLIELLRDGQFSLGISDQGNRGRIFYKQSEIRRRFAKTNQNLGRADKRLQP